MRWLSVLALLAGLALIAAVAAHIGIAPVADAVVRVGWLGFALVVLVGFTLEALSGAALCALLPGRARLWVFVAARQLRDSVGDLLPFTQFGGMMASVRAMVLGGVPAFEASAAIVGDVTAEFASQIALGLFLGMERLRAYPALAPYVGPLVLGTLLLVPAAIAFVAVQRGGGFLVRKLTALFLPAATLRTEAFTAALNAIYDKPWRFSLGVLFHLAGWLASGLWLFVILRLAGASVSLPSAIAIQSLLEALRSATVFVPSALGVQEIGYATLAPLFGMGPEFGLAASLIRRARDAAVGVPVLLAWQAIEGRRFLSEEERQKTGAHPFKIS